MKNILLIAFLFFAFYSNAQTQKIEEAKIEFELPNALWLFDKTETLDNGSIVYSYKRTVENNKLSMILIVENANAEDEKIFYGMYKELSIHKTMPHIKIKEVFSSKDKKSKIFFKKAFGYKAVISAMNKTSYFVHLLNTQKEIQIILECDSNIFNKYETDFLKIMKSVKKL